MKDCGDGEAESGIGKLSPARGEAGSGQPRQGPAGDEPGAMDRTHAQLGSPRLTGLAPFADDASSLLILGSMPGEASLLAGQYYGHPRNHFWRLLYALLDGGEPDADYKARVQFALSRGVALWDVLRTCEREGSLDAAIRRPEANDFAAMFGMHPRIRHVFFNGSAAAELFQRHVRPKLPAGDGRTYRTLPSSSPARAMSFEAKRDAWQPVRDAWLELGRPGGSRR
ncbi:MULTISPECIES: DNA-deoxyinosine glycosylase [unclassified Paenibacillus]|uniref:DNA-deoxyinosine glycosylase n=1 Tax=unclassified Paenibacillus TaxID=185978 RepID=UPI001F3C4BD8|nr:DNA-deoxyinosine glycosylase [Paenibacillus sp. EPM92]